MKNRDRLLNILTLAFVALRLVHYFYAPTALTVLFAVLMLTVVLVSIPTMKRSTRIMLTVLFLGGVALLIYARADAALWLAAINKNGDIVTLFTIVPLISSPFYYSDYQSELKTFAQARVRSVIGFLALVSLFTHTLGVIISIGAVMIVYELMQPFAKLYKADGPFLRTVSRSYNSSGFWSPSWASVIVYAACPEVKWVRVIPVGIALAVLFNAMSLFGIYLENLRHPGRYPDAVPEPGVPINKRRLLGMAALLAAMILSIVVVNVITGWELMLVVSLVSILFPLAVALLQRKMPEYRVQMKRYTDVSLVKVRETIALFALAGFLGKALDAAGAGKLLAQLLPDALRVYPALLIAALMLLMILPALAGVHPAATGTALVAAVTPAAIGLSSYTFVLTILTGWLLAIMLGPFSATALLLSGATGRSSYHTSMGINGVFGVICLVVFSLLISVIGPLMG